MKKSIQSVSTDPKALPHDEFHRTSGAKELGDSTKPDLREGRKWEINIILASQLL